MVLEDALFGTQEKGSREQKSIEDIARTIRDGFEKGGISRVSITKQGKGYELKIEYFNEKLGSSNNFYTAKTYKPNNVVEYSIPEKDFPRIVEYLP